MLDREPKYETVSRADIEGLEAVLRASTRETIPFGLKGESLGCNDCPPAIRHSSDDRIGRGEEVFVEASPAIGV